jgi:hypothetical protein
MGVCLTALGAGAEQRSAMQTPPRWDRNRVLFEIVEGGEVLSCAISKEALQDISDRRYAKPAELLTCFEAARERIEQAARAKYKIRPDPIDGLVTIWSSDLDDPESD